MLTLGCSIDYSDPLYKHSPALPDSEFEESAPLVPLSEPSQIDDLIKDYESGEKSAEECLEILRPFVLSEDHYLSDEFLKKRSFKKSLGLFNRILVENKKNSKDIENDLKRFQAIYLIPCMNDESQCLRLSDLKATPYIDEVIVLVAQNQNETLQNFYKYIFLAFDLGNSRSPLVVLEAYFSRFDELVSSEPFKENKDSLFFRRHMILLGEIVENSDSLNSSNIEDFLVFAKPWEPATHGEGIDSSLKTMSFDLFIKYLKTSDRIKSEFGSYVDSVVNQFKNSELELISQPSPLGINTLEKLNIKTTIFNDFNGVSDFFFGLAIFRSHFDIQQVTQMREALGVQKDFFDSSKSILQIMLANRVILTNQFMNKKFREKTSSSLGENVINSSIFDNFLYEAQLVGEDWIDFADKANLLRDLTLNLTPTQNLSDVNRHFASLDRNIEMVVTYALMMPLMVQMSKMNYNQRIKILWFEFVISARTIMSQFFRGVRKPWFKFTTELNKLYPHELILSFYYSIAIDGFSAFDTTVKEFLEQAYERMIEQNINRYRIYTNQLTGTYFKEGEFQNLVNFCQNPSYTESIRFENLDNFLQGSFQRYFKVDGSPGSPNGFSYYSEVFSQIDTADDGVDIMTIAELLDGVRTDFVHNLELIKHFHKIAKEHSNEDLSSFDTKLAEAEKALNLLMTRVVQIHELSESCQSLRIETERKRQIALVMYEKAYLSDVYNLVTRLKAGEITLEEANQFFKFDESYPDNYHGFDHLELLDGKVVYHYHKLDLMRRVRNYLSYGYIGEQGQNLPAIALHIHPTKFEYTGDYHKPYLFNKDKLISPRVEVSIPVQLRNNSGLQVQVGKKFYSYFSNKFPRLDLEINESTTEMDFIADTLRYFNSRPAAEEKASFKTQMGTWLDSLAGAFLEQRYYAAHFKLVLYKMGEIPIYDFKNPSCLLESSLNHGQCIKSYKISAKNLVEESLKSFLFVDTSDPEEREMYELLQRRTRTDTINTWTGDLKPTLFDVKSNQPLGVFNYMLTGLRQEVLGNNFACISDKGCDAGVTRIGNLRRARSYHETESLDKIFYFPVALGIKSDIFADLKKRVHEEFEQIASFEEEIKKAIASIAEKTDRHSLETFSLKLYTNRPAIQVPWLENNNLSSDTAFQTFNEETGFLFE